MHRALDEETLDSRTQLCNIIYDSGHIPTELEQSIFVTIKKIQMCKIALMLEELAL